uniref:Uncharacterized protein n=1 Tax=Romanomermis culicivorax TaxID=13658 RepID=A0A915JW97_ROMCU
MDVSRKVFALFSFGTAIPNAIVIIYGLLINKMASLDLALSLVSLAAMIIIFVLVTVVPAAINEQVSSTSSLNYL